MLFRNSADKDPVQTPFDGVMRNTLVWGEKTLLMQISIENGAVVTMHDHPHEQVGYCIKGCIELEIEGEIQTCPAGSAWVIPGGAKHEARALEDSLLIELFSPPREDYKD
tara:strand:- start:552 stop:881 length:330 start_codon:yes stop_codon:yes gene_type:complete